MAQLKTSFLKKVQISKTMEKNQQNGDVRPSRRRVMFGCRGGASPAVTGRASDSWAFTTQTARGHHVQLLHVPQAGHNEDGS